MASPSSHDDDGQSSSSCTAREYGARSRARYWNPFELQAVCALVCKGAHLGSPLSFASKLNKILNGTDGSEDIDIDDIEELLYRIKTEKVAALAFIKRQGVFRITRAQMRVFARDLGFDGTKTEWEEGRKEKVMQARKARLEEEAAKRDGNTAAADGTRIDRWTPSQRVQVSQTDARIPGQDQVAETSGAANQPISMQDKVLPTHYVANRTPSYGEESLKSGIADRTNRRAAGYTTSTQVWGNPSTPGWGGYMPPPAGFRSTSWGATASMPSRGSTPPWRSGQHWGPAYQDDPKEK